MQTPLWNSTMSIHSKGHFAAKHPPGTRVAPVLDQTVREHLKGGRITCHQAHGIAEKLNTPPIQVGVAIDLAEGRILKCQLGLFGYGKGEKKVKAAEHITPALRNAIEAALEKGHLPCAAAWRIASQYGLPRIAVAHACEALGVRIRPCQLGAF